MHKMVDAERALAGSRPPHGAPDGRPLLLRPDPLAWSAKSGVAQKPMLVACARLQSGAPQRPPCRRRARRAPPRREARRRRRLVARSELYADVAWTSATRATSPLCRWASKSRPRPPCSPSPTPRRAELRRPREAHLPALVPREAPLPSEPSDAVHQPRRARVGRTAGEHARRLGCRAAAARLEHAGPHGRPAPLPPPFPGPSWRRRHAVLHAAGGSRRGGVEADGQGGGGDEGGDAARARGHHVTCPPRRRRPCLATHGQSVLPSPRPSPAAWRAPCTRDCGRGALCADSTTLLSDAIKQAFAAHSCQRLRAAHGRLRRILAWQGATHHAKTPLVPSRRDVVRRLPRHAAFTTHRSGKQARPESLPRPARPTPAYHAAARTGRAAARATSRSEAPVRRDPRSPRPPSCSASRLRGSTNGSTKNPVDAVAYPALAGRWGGVPFSSRGWPGSASRSPPRCWARTSGMRQALFRRLRRSEVEWMEKTPLRSPARARPS